MSETVRKARSTIAIQIRAQLGPSSNPTNIPHGYPPLTDMNLTDSSHILANITGVWTEGKLSNGSEISPGTVFKDYSDQAITNLYCSTHESDPDLFGFTIPKAPEGKNGVVQFTISWSAVIDGVRIYQEEQIEVAIVDYRQS